MLTKGQLGVSGEAGGVSTRWHVSTQRAKFSLEEVRNDETR